MSCAPDKLGVPFQTAMDVQWDRALLYIYAIAYYCLQMFSLYETKSSKLQVFTYSIIFLLLLLHYSQNTIKIIYGVNDRFQSVFSLVSLYPFCINFEPENKFENLDFSVYREIYHQKNFLESKTFPPKDMSKELNLVGCPRWRFFKVKTQPFWVKNKKICI